MADKTIKKEKRPIRSVKLSKEEFRDLKSFIKSYPTQVDASMEIGIARESLLRIALIGKGSEKYVNRIREYFAKQEATA